MKEKRSPNLFDYATSELSQDALICWLLKWSESKYKIHDPELYKCANHFLCSILDKPTGYKVDKIEIKRQKNNIDILAIINDDLMLVIEDKVFTSEHSGQLTRYKTYAKKYSESKGYNLYLVYFKMLEQGSYDTVLNSGFNLYQRKQMLLVLSEYASRNPESRRNNILTDYYQYLSEIEKKVQSFNNQSFENWDEYSWIGFYSHLQKYLRKSNWRYIPNQSGGFLGFYWYFISFKFTDTTSQIYLQLEEDRLVIKLSVDDSTLRRKIRDVVQQHLLDTAKALNIKVLKFGRLGKAMSIAKLDFDYRSQSRNQLLNFDNTINILKQLEYLVDQTINKVNPEL